MFQDCHTDVWRQDTDQDTAPDSKQSNPKPNAPGGSGIDNQQHPSSGCGVGDKTVAADRAHREAPAGGAPLHSRQAGCCHTAGTVSWAVHRQHPKHVCWGPTCPAQRPCTTKNRSSVTSHPDSPQVHKLLICFRKVLEPQLLVGCVRVNKRPALCVIREHVVTRQANHVCHRVLRVQPGLGLQGCVVRVVKGDGVTKALAACMRACVSPTQGRRVSGSSSSVCMRWLALR